MHYSLTPNCFVSLTSTLHIFRMDAIVTLATPVSAVSIGRASIYLTPELSNNVVKTVSPDYPIVEMSTGASSPATKTYFDTSERGGYLKRETKSVIYHAAFTISVMFAINERVYALNSGVGSFSGPPLVEVSYKFNLRVRNLNSTS